MNFKRLAAATAMLGLVLASVNGIAEDKAPEKDGKAVFTAAKCDMCHSVTVQKIKEDKPKNDLSKVGEAGDAAFFKKFLKKEAEVKGKKHGMAFKGTDEDLDILAKWLESLKEAKEVK